jgi:serine/threonine-protein kinase
LNAKEEKDRKKTKSAPIKVCPKCYSAYRTNRSTCPGDGTALIDREVPPGFILAGKYRVGEEIGRGGMGVVCRGAHIIMDKPVAIKIINPILSADPKFLDMFKAEARSLAAFRHPNVLTVHDFGESRGHYFLVMELLEGRSLKTEMREAGRIPPERAFLMLVQICDAVAAAHRVGIVHLDLKGENVFLSESGGAREIKVLDFGLARLAGGRAQVVNDSMTIGTVGYMAPEQIMGEHVDERTDVYALGVLAFEMVTGHLPFPAGSKSRILTHQIQGRTIKWPRMPVLKVIPRKARRAIMSAVRPDPHRRPQSADRLRDTFAEALQSIEHRVAALAGRHARLPAQKRTSIWERARSLGRRPPSPPAGPPPPEGMAYVPEGEFIMGTNRGHPDQAPALRTPLRPFFIDVVPVTNRDYARFVEATDHAPPTNWKTLSFPPGRGDLPVTGVTWQDAVDYASWVGKRLPTEAEWEKAARGTDGRAFPWGNRWEPTCANWGGNPAFYGKAAVKPVGSFPDDRSPYGCLDMAGNVSEWTATWYQAYGPSGYRSDDFGEKFRVVRGGSWVSNDTAYLTCTRRGHAKPDTTGDVGFRCVKDL